jgi:hypothetical protein
VASDMEPSYLIFINDLSCAIDSNFSPPYAHSLVH